MVRWDQRAASVGTGFDSHRDGFGGRLRPGVSVTTACVACGAPEMRPHLKVRGDMGSEGLIPTTDRFGVALGDIVRCTRCGPAQVGSHARRRDARPRLRCRGIYRLRVGADRSARDSARLAGAAGTARSVRHRAARHRRWVGYLLDEARRRGWDAVGVEPSAFAAAFARYAIIGQAGPRGCRFPSTRDAH